MDEKEPFEILPYMGTRDLRFGMTSKEVEVIFGVPDSVSLNHLKQRVEFRSFMNVGYSDGTVEIVSNIGFGRQMECVHIKDIYFFCDDESVVLNKLISEDGNPFLYLGFIVLLNLGMTLTGFHDADISQKSVALFERGAWDKRLPKLKPFP